MINVLQNDYISHFGLAGKYTLHSYPIQGNMVLNDDKSCRQCKSNNAQKCDSETNEQTFMFFSDVEVSLVEIEDFLNQFEGKRAGVKDKCDLMLYDNQNIAFVEMYCGEQKYMYPYINQKGLHEGKLAKARKQLNSTINKLSEVQSIKIKMDGYDKKTGIFACRKKSESSNGSVDEENMQVFLNTTLESKAHTLLSNNFRFVQVEYPEVYTW